MDAPGQSDPAALDVTSLQQPQAPEPNVAPEKPSGAGWWVGGILMVLGIFGAAVVAGLGIGRAIALSTPQRVNVPSTRAMALEAGTYQVKVDDSSYSYTINPRIFVESPDGKEVEVNAGGSIYSDPSYSSYSSARRLGYFDAPTSGIYTVRTERRTDVADEFPVPPTTRWGTTTTTRFGTSRGPGYPIAVAVSRADDEAATRSVPLIVGGALGGLALVVVAAIILGVTASRLARANRARPPEVGAPRVQPPTYSYAQAIPAPIGGPGPAVGPFPVPGGQGPGPFPVPGGQVPGPFPVPGGGGPGPFPVPGGQVPGPFPVPGADASTTPIGATFTGPPRGPAYPGPPPPGYGGEVPAPAQETGAPGERGAHPEEVEPGSAGPHSEESEEVSSEAPPYGEPPFPDPTRGS